MKLREGVNGMQNKVIDRCTQKLFYCKYKYFKKIPMIKLSQGKNIGSHK